MSYHTLEELNYKFPVLINQNLDVGGQELQRFLPFKNWADKLEKMNTRGKNDTTDLKVDKVIIESVDKFRSGDIGFLKLKVEAELDGEKIPGIVVLRGHSVSVLLLVKTDDNDTNPKVVLVSQPRLAIPVLTNYELPAGMMDGTGDLHSKAIAELNEETGIAISKEQLHPLCPEKLIEDQGFHTSGGLLDERLTMYYATVRMSKEELVKLDGRLAGQRSEGEMIKVKLVPLNDIIGETRDIKAIASLALYWNLIGKGGLNSFV